MVKFGLCVIHQNKFNEGPLMNEPKILLGVNIDHVATLRQARKTFYPDPIQAAIESEQAGADGITLHLREDRRHIQDYDVIKLKEVLKTRMNLEMAATPEMVEIAKSIGPTYCCLVPERRKEITTEGGLNVLHNETYLHDVCKELRDSGILVSLFIDPDFSQLDAALRCEAPLIEIHTGHYADSSGKEQQIELNRIKEMATHAKAAGLLVNAGHGLHYTNVQAIAEISEITELNIGHSIIARSIFVGIKNAVSEMKLLMLEARKM